MRATDLAWAEELEQIDDAFEAAISDERYEWPNQTRRKNGQTVGSPRDIVDTGSLRDSQYRNTITPEITEFGWTKSNPELNHNGGMSSYNGTRYYHQPRPWTQHAIKGDLSAPIEYQRDDAMLDVPADFERRLDAHLEAMEDAADS